MLLPDRVDHGLDWELRRLAATFPDRCYLSLNRRFRPNDDMRLRDLQRMADAAGVPTIVTGDVLYHAAERRILQDVITCIREHCTIEDAGFRRERFIERHLKSLEEVARIYPRHADAVARTTELVELSYQYPDESEIEGETPQQALERLVHESVPLRYAHGLPDDVARQLKHELRLIAQLAYAPYFLPVNSIVRYARMPAGGWSDCTSGWWRT